VGEERGRMGGFKRNRKGERDEFSSVPEGKTMVKCWWGAAGGPATDKWSFGRMQVEKRKVRRKRRSVHLGRDTMKRVWFRLCSGIKTARRKDTGGTRESEGGIVEESSYHSDRQCRPGRHNAQNFLLQPVLN